VTQMEQQLDQAQLATDFLVLFQQLFVSLSPLGCGVCQPTAVVEDLLCDDGPRVDLHFPFTDCDRQRSS